MTTSHAQIDQTTQHISRQVNDGVQSLQTQTNLLLTLVGMAKAANESQQEGNVLLQELMMKVLDSTLQTFQLVLQLRNDIPAQVMREQPVQLMDARGEIVPVHLEFIKFSEVSKKS
jgi:hypothetical protein